MKKMLTLGDPKRIDRDLELLHTTNENCSKEAVQILIDDQIPFTRSSLSIPFFLRSRFHNADEMYFIHINRNRYRQALTSMKRLSPQARKNLILKAKLTA